MSAQQIVDKVLDYRDGDTLYARLDLQAALSHSPYCSTCNHRFGSDPAALRAALELLG